MLANNRELARKWIYLSLSLLTLVALLVGIVVIKTAAEAPVGLASQTKPADANQPSEQQAKDPNNRKPPRPEHKHPAFSQRIEERVRMVANQIQARDVNDPNVLKAMRIVPRHAFVRPGEQHYAYNDHPLPIGLGQTISQPYIVAFMTEALKLDPNDKVLEIGTGSGYQAAVCAEIAQEVYTIEILDELAKSAARKLKELGYRNVFVRAGDGYLGWPERPHSTPSSAPLPPGASPRR